ncbi:MAG TPA: Hsp20/alpha crystallin family protein [Candidatus Binataceae bacterium]|nr:Hsp20/alpha crystallin family protein [Candidatus Binataceae bacterium]
MAKRNDKMPGPFESVLDEFFDELLIEKWRRGATEFEQAEIVERAEHYEVRVITEGVDPTGIEVEGLGRRVTVRSVSANRRAERSFTFSETIDAEAATARWSGGTLTITLPKQKPRRIRLKDS